MNETETGNINIKITEKNILKLRIDILNYVDTIEVYIDELKLDIKKLSLSSWKRGIVFNWISCLFGVPDWTLREKEIDTKNYSTILKVKVNQDVKVNLKLASNGFELLECSEEILDVKNHTGINEIAKKRVRNAYIIPAITLAVLIEICMLMVCGFFIVNNKYDLFIIVFCIAVFWAWLVYKISL